MFSDRLADYRMGNAPKYYLGAAPAEIDMRVPDTVRKCVFFIGFRDVDDSILYGGTAFVVTVPGSYAGSSFGYVVTARHVIEASDNKPFVMRINLRDAESVTLEATAQHWLFHDDPTVDVAVAPLIFYDPLDVDILAIPVSNFLTDEIIRELRIGTGDQVFITGLFTRAVGTSRNMPIVRMGTVALMPTEKIPHASSLIDAYLIEHHSIGGLSGSPAFVSQTAIIPFPYTDKKLTREDLVIFAPGQTFFMGLVRGHWETPPNPLRGLNEGMNLGISVVVPAQKIKDILYSENCIAQRKQKEEQQMKKDGALDTVTPNKRTQRTENDLEIPIPSEKDFVAALEKASKKLMPEKN
jgi:hypothetical protein